MFSDSIFQIVTNYAVGFLFAVIVGHFAIKWIVDLMWVYIHSQDPRSRLLVRFPEQAQIVGVVERGLYYAALIVNQPILIGVWLTLKTVSKPPRWHLNKGRIPGRAVFQPFLVGNGLSLLFAGAGYAFTFLLQSKNEDAIGTIAAILLGLLVIFLICFWLANSAFPKKKTKRKSKKSQTKN